MTNVEKAKKLREEHFAILHFETFGEPDWSGTYKVGCLHNNSGHLRFSFSTEDEALSFLLHEFRDQKTHPANCGCL